MIPNKHYACYIIVLAAIGLASCQKAPDATQGAGTAAADAQSSRQSEAEVPANTVLWVRLQKDLDSSKLKSGDRFNGEVAEDVILNGKPVIPKGTSVQGRVTNSQTAQSQGSSGLLSLVVDSFTLKGTSYNVTTNPVTLQGAPLEQSLPANDKSNKAVSAVENAYAPKHGILQFFTTSAVRVKA